jgi:uncharacterized protein (DUF1501 family)
VWTDETPGVRRGTAMLNLMGSRPLARTCSGSRRREFLQVGTLALAGLALPDLLRARQTASASGLTTKDTSVILLWLDGGASHIETFDPKPDAPKEYRCIFGATPTRLPGVEFGGLFPKMAAVADRLAIVRSFVHRDGDHGGATHWVKTGYPWPPQFLGKAPIIDQTHPSIGSIVARARGPLHPRTGLPTYVRLTQHGGYPGDGPAWLGKDYAPFRPYGEALNNMALKVPADRLDDRKALLKALDDLDRTIDQAGLMRGMDALQQQALDVVVGGAKQAFDLNRENDRTRERYGPGLGQHLLLARRLCEAGAGFVTVHHDGWDHHSGLLPGCKKLCPPLDHAVATFLEDVRQRGLDRTILLVITGEFGRSPRIGGDVDTAPGRDHWAGLCTLALAGGGLQMGQVVGESTAKAEMPRSKPLTPQDLMATIFHVLGIDRKIQFTHPSGRPTNMIEDGEPIAELV